MTWDDYLGWFGTVLYLLNYAYLAFWPRWKRRIYFLANAIAATALVVTSALLFSWQAVGINGFWALISLWSLWGTGFSFLRVPRPWLFWGTVLLWIVAVGYLFLDWQTAIGLVGWSSTWAFSLAYLLFAAGRMPVKRYHVWNAYAALVLLPQLYLDSNWPVFGMETAWFCISLGTLIRMAKSRQVAGTL